MAIVSHKIWRCRPCLKNRYFYIMCHLDFKASSHYTKRNATGQDEPYLSCNREVSCFKHSPVYVRYRARVSKYAAVAETHSSGDSSLGGSHQPLDLAESCCCAYQILASIAKHPTLHHMCMSLNFDCDHVVWQWGTKCELTT